MCFAEYSVCEHSFFLFPSFLDFLLPTKAEVDFSNPIQSQPQLHPQTYKHTHTPTPMTDMFCFSCILLFLPFPFFAILFRSLSLFLIQILSGFFFFSVVVLFLLSFLLCSTLSPYCELPLYNITTTTTTTTASPTHFTSHDAFFRNTPSHTDTDDTLFYHTPDGPLHRDMTIPYYII